LISTLYSYLSTQASLSHQARTQFGLCQFVTSAFMTEKGGFPAQVINLL
jgi:hypothetical protein